ELRPGAQPTWRNAQGFIGAEPLPSGRYVTRAKIMRGGKVAAVLVRPFILEPAPASKGGPVVIPAAFARVATFDRNAVLQPALVSGMLDSIAAASPSLKSAVTEARAGRYGSAALASRRAAGIGPPPVSGRGRSAPGSARRSPTRCWPTRACGRPDGCRHLRAEARLRAASDGR